MNRSLIRGFGVALVIWGVVLVSLESVTLTGFTIVEDIGHVPRSFLGVVSIAGGIALLFYGRNTSRSSLRHENREARAAARWAYQEEYGHTPTHEQLLAFERGYHERNELGDLVESWKHRRRAA